MKEAIGNSFLVTLAITLMSLVMVILVASFVYSKTYKVKNRIINIMEKRAEYTSEGEGNVKDEIYQALAQMGYRVNSSTRRCPSIDIPDPTSGTENNVKLLHDTNFGSYDFCLYEIRTSRGYYYHVITYTHYDVPIIGETLNFTIKGDTRTIYEEVGG